MDPQGTGKSNNSLVFIIVILGILLVAALAGGYWAFSGRQDYKNNADKKIAAAVAAAEKTQAAKLQQQFNEVSKSPYKTYKGPQTYGSVSFAYPKSWSAYVDESQSSEPINGYFHPDQVPAVKTNVAYALRVELVSTPYDQVLRQYQSSVTRGDATASAYIPPKMKSVANVQSGTYFRYSDNDGAALVIGVRDKTLQVYTESDDFLNDFNNIILASLTFVP